MPDVSRVAARITGFRALCPRFLFFRPTARRSLAVVWSTRGVALVLDTGEPVKFVDVSRSVAELSGLQVRDDNNPQGDAELGITGLPAGEKLYEELLISDNSAVIQQTRICKAHELCLRGATCYES